MLNSTNRSGNGSSFDLPTGLLALTPFILLLAVVAAVSNTVLLVLIVKATCSRVQNTTNIYLFSLGVAGLLESCILFTLFTIVTTGRWLFGIGICYINTTMMSTAIVSKLLFHLLISRDRYKAVRDPFEWKPYNKMAFIFSAIV